MRHPTCPFQGAHEGRPYGGVVADTDSLSLDKRNKIG
jgi:hypothetical protein